MQNKEIVIYNPKKTEWKHILLTDENVHKNKNQRQKRFTKDFMVGNFPRDDFPGESFPGGIFPRTIQFTTHFFDFESKKLYGNRCRSNDRQR